MIIDDQMKKNIDGIRPHYPTEQALLLPLLHEIQAKQGWISPEASKEAADYLHLPLSKVEEVLTFYTMYNRKPIGKYHVQVCTNISCFLRGSDQIMACMEKSWGSTVVKPQPMDFLPFQRLSALQLVVLLQRCRSTMITMKI